MSVQHLQRHEDPRTLPCPEQRDQINQRAFERYYRLYHNQTFGAIERALDHAGILDSYVDLDEMPATDFMNLVTDGALWMCGHVDYVGTLGTPISQAHIKIEALIKAVPFLQRIGLAMEVERHLSLFATTRQVYEHAYRLERLLAAAPDETDLQAELESLPRVVRTKAYWSLSDRQRLDDAECFHDYLEARRYDAHERARDARNTARLLSDEFWAENEL